MKILRVRYNQYEQVDYYLDKDKWSRAHDKGNVITLDAWEGTYTFNKLTKKVFLDTGVKKLESTIWWWEVLEVEDD